MLSLLSIGRIARSTRGGALRRAPQFRPARPLETARWYGTSRPTLGLEEFRDSVPREQRLQEDVGRSWSVKELRRKSFDDLWKLWLVLYKERNMLLTEKQISRRRSIEFPQPERWRKVKKSMQAIRHVMGERKLEKIAQAKQRSRERDEALKNQSSFDNDVEEDQFDVEDDEFDGDDEFEEDTKGGSAGGEKTR